EALLSGAAAGLLVDLSLYPLDTLKTRAQSSAGFWSSGGLRGLFQGVSVVSLLSMPGAAVFFVTYDTGKRRRLPVPVAACLGEAAACLVRVPCEVVKQRAQTDRLGRRPYRIFADCLREEGPAGLYRGFRSTIIRELPFASLQFPLWEALKALAGPGWADKPATSAASGFAAGGLAAFLTTPLDVAKTRIMLASSHDRLASGSVLAALSTVHSERGLPGLFAGAAPRTAMIAIGGAVFLGVYDTVRLLLSRLAS
ncbi:hypothetical protein BOX15_Mlig018227g2, partial [Macrostomum lignano]